MNRENWASCSPHSISNRDTWLETDIYALHRNAISVRSVYQSLNVVKGLVINMQKRFLAKNAQRVSNEQMRFALFACIGMLVIFSVLMILDMLSDEDILGAFPVPIPVFVGIFLFLILLLFVRSLKNNGNAYNDLIVHPGGVSKEDAGQTIDSEAAQGKVLLDEYAEYGKTKGDRIVLLPSYLLICTGRRVTAIPTGKIFWTCAQVGIKGSSNFIVQIKVYAENKMFALIGADVTHFKDIEEKLYRYIPNVFSGYDTFDLSHKLDALFLKDYDKFLEFYGQHKETE